MKKYIPVEFDTDFYLARWWRAYDGDIQQIEKRMKEVFEHRKLLGYDCIDRENLEYKLEIPRRTFEVTYANFSSAQL